MNEGENQRTRLTGVPPDKAIRMVKFDPNQYVSEIKKNIQRIYKLNPIHAIQLIFKGKIIPDNVKLAKMGIHPEKDIITIMAMQSGG